MRRRRPRDNRRTTSRSSTIGAVLAVTALALSGCGDDDADDGGAAASVRDEYGVLLLEPGGGDAAGSAEVSDRVDLPADYDVGQAAVTTMVMQFALSLDAGSISDSVEFSLEMVMTEAVVEVDDGVATVEASVEEIRVLEGPPEAERELERELGALIGQVVVFQLSETGATIGDIELKGGGAMPESMADMFEQGTTTGLFPSVPVGVGARWSAIDDIDIEGVIIEGETIYELVDLTADHYVVGLTQDIPVDERVDGADMEGSYEATGTIRGDRHNPLAIEMTYEQEGRFRVSDGSDEATISTYIALDMSTG